MRCVWTVCVVLFSTVFGSDLHAQAPALDRPLRAIHISGNWGANPEAVAKWEADRTRPLLPPDYIQYLKDVHVDWVGLSVALHVEDSMDSTVERSYSTNLDIPTFSDAALRQIVREYREHGFKVYMTLAFEIYREAFLQSGRPVRRWQLGDPGDPDAGVPLDHEQCADCARPIRPESWPWRPTHPDHDRFVEEFWRTYTEQAVHFGRIAQEEGVSMYSLGTETDDLFRTRSWDRYWRNDFGRQLGSLVHGVRAVYDGLLTYDMHHTAFTGEQNALAGSPASRYLWEDLGLDVVGISAWFPLVEEVPSTVLSVDDLQQAYEGIFRDYLVPLASINPGRPIVFLEYGTMDTMGGPAAPSDTSAEFRLPVVSDVNENGIEDGQETQANMFSALFETMDRYPGLVYGAFFWDNWIAGNEDWRTRYGIYRTFSFRGKPAEEAVRARYDGVRPLLWLPAQTLHVGGGPIVVQVADVFQNPLAAYHASSSIPGVATVGVSGGHVAVRPVAEGATTVTVTATGADGPLGTLQFVATVQRDPDTDRGALEALYRATDGDTWIDNGNWLNSGPLDHWYGVETDRFGRVVGLRLGGWDEASRAFVGNGLAGSLPPEIGALSHLRRLEVAGNRGLAGPIPSEVGNLANLRQMHLSDNALTGPIPAGLGNLVSLRALGLGGNALTGTIPATLANLTNLELLQLWGDAWTPEPAPEWLGALINLRRLSLGGHRFSGPIPATWQGLDQLEEVDLWGNALTGPIPAWLGTLTKLRILNLGSNALTGGIPSTFGNLASLRDLGLERTVLSGPIPLNLTRLPDLARFSIEGTGVCVPNDDAMQAWLATIVDFASSQLPCGESPTRVTVAYQSAAEAATEGESAYLRVRMSEAARPARAVTIALTATPGRGATPADYRVPGTVTFGRDHTAATIEVTALRDSDVDHGETVTVGFGALPPGVVAGTPATATVTLGDDLRRFTDAALTPGETVVRGIHVAELRQLVDVVRAACGLPSATWTDRVLAPGEVPIKAVHLTELRAALTQAYGACSLSLPAYTDPVIVTGETPIKAVHWMELRATGLRALEATTPP